MTATNAVTWAVDPGHSNVHFKIKHIGITNVNGTFDTFQGNVDSTNDDFDGASVHFEIDADSINTNNADRDKHLKSPFLFDTEQFPKLIFDGTLQKKGEGYMLNGELTIRDTKRPIVLDATFTGNQQGMFNDTRAGFEADGKLNRKDYGLTWNILTQAGDFVVGDEVKLSFDIQLIKK